MRCPLKYDFTNKILEDQNEKVVLYQSVLESVVIDEINTYFSLIEGRKVICGIENISWTEKEIKKEDPMFNYIFNSDLREHFKYLSSFEADSFVKIWASIYNESEFINPHKDRSGNYQALLCIANTENKENGNLFLEIDRKNKEIHLEKGDMIFFDASKVRHYTTPTKDKKTNRTTLAIRTYK